MTPFQASFRAYDLLYKDLDHAAEVRFVLERLQAHGPRPDSILDLGCGTGRHCRLFARKGLRTHGLDRCEAMLEKARGVSPRESAWPRYHVGDVRQARLGFTVDAVVSLFHVASYQTVREDLAAMLGTARAHLEPGGLFLFDFWHGPAVLSEPPSVRVRRVQDDSLSLVRISEPTLDTRACIVEVNYTLLLLDKQSSKLEDLRETHRMRYYFEPELALMADLAGFDTLETAPWLEAGRAPTARDFGVYTLLRRRG